MEHASEKRARRYIFKPSDNVWERMVRAGRQKMYLVDQVDISSEERGKFAILGTNGNVYDVIIDKEPTCNCPDCAVRGNKCKHIIFVMAKVLGVMG